MMDAIGFDVSTWQDSPVIPGHINFDKAHLAGASFCFIKASQATFQDPDFAINWQASKAAGLIRGTYHYLDWTRPALDQARFYAGVVAADPGEMIVLDYECRKNVPPAGTARQAAHDFLVEIMRLTGKLPLVYTSPGYWAEFGSADAYWTQFPLWIAHYGVAKPSLPKPWARWHFWQYTAKGNGDAYGVESRDVDLDVFNGDETALRAFAGLDDPPVIPPQDWRFAITTWARQLGYTGPDPEGSA